MKAAVERDVVKLQNSLKKVSDELKISVRRGDQLDRKIDSLKDVYLPITDFSEQIKVYAPLVKLDAMRKMVDKCALHDQTND